MLGILTTFCLLSSLVIVLSWPGLRWIKSGNTPWMEPIRSFIPRNNIAYPIHLPTFMGGGRKPTIYTLTMLK